VIVPLHFSWSGDGTEQELVYQNYNFTIELHRVLLIKIKKLHLTDFDDSTLTTNMEKGYTNTYNTFKEAAIFANTDNDKTNIVNCNISKCFIKQTTKH